MVSRFSSIFPLMICLLLAACGSPEDRAANYLKKAEALYEQEDYVTARIEAMNAAQIEPRNADVRFLLAEIEEKENNFRKAIGHLQVAIDADTNHLESRIKLGNYYIMAKAADLATEQAAAAVKLAPDDPNALLLQARVDFMNKNIDAAMQGVDAVLARDPKLVDAIIFKAGLYMAKGDTDDAEKLVQENIKSVDADGTKKLRQFRILLLVQGERFAEIEADLKALAADYPDEDSFPLALAQLYVTQKRIDEAETIYRDYIEKDPKDAKRRIAFVRFIGAQHGTEAAEKTLQQYVADLPDSMELQLALGQLYEGLKKQDDALATYQKIADTDPKSPIGYAARNRITAIRIQQNDLESAKAVIESILTDDQDNADALMLRAAFAYTGQRFDDAVTDLRTVLRVTPDSERALLLLAKSHSAANNPELAQDAYRRLIELNPAHPAASAELAELLARGGDVPMAEEVLREQLAAAPEDRRTASSLIQALLLQGDVEGAETQARTMLDLGDETGLAEFQLGRVLQAKKSSQQAIDAYKAALEKSPNAPEPLQGLVAVLINDDRPDEAIKFLRAHLEKYPTQLAPRLLLAAIFTQQGKTEAAAEQYEEIISLQPNATRAYASLASLYPDDPSLRRSIYQRGIDANPEDPAVNLLLAGEYERAGQIEEAIKIYEKILGNNANNIMAANNLASLILDYRSDKESYERALELSKGFEDSNQGALLDTLGWAYYRNGNYDHAIRLLEAAVAANDGIALLHYHLGMALTKAGMVQRGRDALKKSLSMTEDEFPGIEDARATLEQLDSN